MKTLDKIIESVSRILLHRFNAGPKTEIKETEYSYNIACPYCLDSAKRDSKRRGHLYKDSLAFHCYNCGIHRSIFDFLKDFGELNKLSFEEMDNIDAVFKSNIAAQNTIKNSVNVNAIFDNQLINQYAFSYNHIKDFYKLVNVKGTIAEKYLLQRGQRNLDIHLYDPVKNSVWILNTTKTNKIIGAQIRTLSKSTQIEKYYTKSLKKIYSDQGMLVTDEISQLNKISLIFNILHVDFSQPIKVLEGPFDANLLSNSIATLGLLKTLPFYFDSMVFIFDHDKAGTRKALEFINKGYKVFLWDKFLKDHQKLAKTFKEKIDITDIIVNAKKYSLPINSLNNYYSADIYDAYFL